MSEKSLLMGNRAIALGAIRAGIGLAAGYPGTPSSEILETVADNNDGSIYVEWSTNEKAAMEVAAGAAYSGVRSLVTMKQVGLNVASDPLMSLAYIGVKGGMVIVSADDPGPISSQTEQDSRHFAKFAKIPVFDPATPEEAYLMIGDAFELSEKLGTPVIFRPTTRVCHASASVELLPPLPAPKPEGFVRDTSRFVIFPRLSYANHIKIEKRNASLSETLSEYRFNEIINKSSKCRKAVAASGVSVGYALEALDGADIKLLKIATAHPFPEKIALEFFNGVDEVLVLEELDPVIEQALLLIAGKHHLTVTVKGKLSGNAKVAGENSVESCTADIFSFLGVNMLPDVKTPDRAHSDGQNTLALPVRPPVLCAGCPHRASFFAVKEACKGVKAFFCGDIGCYTLGNAMPLDMVDTCLCMGADITIAQGIKRTNPDAQLFSFIGDSTFFASGMTGIVNAVYNNTDIILIVLDNSTTAMTGHQPHPGTGKTMMHTVTEKVSIPAILDAVGVSNETVDPTDTVEAKAAVGRALAKSGVRAVIFKSPCIALIKKSREYTIESERCIGCGKCVRTLGCPAITVADGKYAINGSLCYGCSVCAPICPKKAIVEKL